MTPQDAVAIVVGGDRGVGANITAALVEAGARVVVTAPPREPLASTRAGDRMALSEGDVATADGADAAVRTALEQFGRLDFIVVHPTRAAKPSGDVSADLQHAVREDLRAAYTTLKHSTIVFRSERAGRVVMVIPRDGLTGSGDSPVAAAVAGGLVGLTKAVSLGMRRYGVPCNAVAFSSTDPDSIATLAALCAYLGGDVAPEFTGNVFSVEGRAISLWAHERPVSSVFDASGTWDVDDLPVQTRAALATDPLQLLKGPALARAGG